MSASVDVDFVARFPANCWFFWRNRRISRMHALRNVTLLTSFVQPLRREKRENKRENFVGNNHTEANIYSFLLLQCKYFHANLYVAKFTCMW